jgi:Flp pilus assembly protein TadD
MTRQFPADRPHRLSASGLAVAGLLALAGCAQPGPATSYIGTVPDEQTPAKTMAALMRAGDATRASGDLASAVAFYRRAHAIATDQALPLVRLGETLAGLGAQNEAAESFRAALERDPKDADAHRGLGNAMLALHQPQIAIQSFNSANAIKPDARSYNGIGIANDMIGSHRAAQVAYQQGLQLTSSNLQLQNNFALSLMLSGDYPEAIEILRAVTSDPAATPRHRQNLAMAHGLAGDIKEAARVARLDLEEAQVQNNLSYYLTLRSLNDSSAIAQALGINRVTPSAKD